MDSKTRNDASATAVRGAHFDNSGIIIHCTLGTTFQSAAAGKNKFAMQNFPLEVGDPLGFICCP